MKLSRSAAAAFLLLLLGTIPVRAELPAGLREVPGDAALFVHIHVKELLASPGGKEVRRGFAQIDETIAEYKKQGFDIEGLDSFTLYIPKSIAFEDWQENLQMVFHFVEPFDKATLFTAEVIKRELKGGVLPLSKGYAALLVDPRTFIAAPEKLALELAGQKKEKAASGVLDAAIASAQKRHFTFAINLDELPDEIKKTPEEFARPFLPLLNARTLTFQAQAGKDLEFDLTFGCESAEKAKTVKGSFDLASRIVKTVLDNLPPIEKDDQVYGPLLKIFQKSLSEMKVAEVKKDVRVHLTVPGGSAFVDTVKAVVEQARRSAPREQNTNNLKQIALAMHNYHGTYETFPAAAICSRKGAKLLSWRVAILPFIEQEELYKKFKLDEPWDSEHNKKLIAEMPDVYLLPGEEAKAGKTHYKVFTGNGACFDIVRGTKLGEILDGTSNTLMAATAAEAVEWTKPDDIPFDPKADMQARLHWENDRATVAFCDGSVRSFPKKIKTETLNAMITKAGGEVYNFED